MSIGNIDYSAVKRPLFAGKRLFNQHLGVRAGQARCCGAASEPRSGGVRKTKGDPRLRGDDIRLEPGGFLPLNIQKSPQMRQNCRLS